MTERCFTDENLLVAVWSRPWMLSTTVDRSTALECKTIEER
jgi:hypothetical protein